MVRRRCVKRALVRPLAIASHAALILSASYDAAFAYLDPGTGSIILQGLIAGVVGTAALARMYWGRLKDILRRAFASGHREGDLKN
jgi:hypothetical protein